MISVVLFKNVNLQWEGETYAKYRNKSRFVSLTTIYSQVFSLSNSSARQSKKTHNRSEFGSKQPIDTKQRGPLFVDKYAFGGVQEVVARRNSNFPNGLAINVVYFNYVTDRLIFCFVVGFWCQMSQVGKFLSGKFSFSAFLLTHQKNRLRVVGWLRLESRSFGPNRSPGGPSFLKGVDETHGASFGLKIVLPHGFLFWFIKWVFKRWPGGPLFRGVICSHRTPLLAVCAPCPLWPHHWLAPAQDSVDPHPAP